MGFGVKTADTLQSSGLKALESVVDAQSARNACFPDGASSPVVGLLLLSFTAAMDHMLLCGDSPLRALSLTLVQMMAILGPLASESVAAMAEGDFVFTEGDDHPSAHEVQQTMEALRAEMELATDEMIRWRLQKDDQSGLKADRRLYAAILTIEEMRYYDLFPTLTLIQTILKNYQWRFQTALFERNQDRIQQAAMAGQQTQWEWVALHGWVPHDDRAQHTWTASNRPGAYQGNVALTRVSNGYKRTCAWVYERLHATSSVDPCSFSCGSLFAPCLSTFVNDTAVSCHCCALASWLKLVSVAFRSDVRFTGCWTHVDLDSCCILLHFTHVVDTTLSLFGIYLNSACRDFSFMSQHQPPASGLFSMSNLGEVWEALRGAGLEHLAPSLVRHGVVSLNQLVLRHDELHASGLTHWQLESILAAAHPPAAGPGDESQDGARVDLPVRQMGKRASIQAALEAARPNQRQRSLQALDQDVLARTTNSQWKPGSALTWLFVELGRSRHSRWTITTYGASEPPWRRGDIAAPRSTTKPCVGTSSGHCRRLCQPWSSWGSVIASALYREASEKANSKMPSTGSSWAISRQRRMNNRSPLEIQTTAGTWPWLACGLCCVSLS